jgi:hypothetical protein
MKKSTTATTTKTLLPKAKHHLKRKKFTSTPKPEFQYTSNVANWVTFQNLIEYLLMFYLKGDQCMIVEGFARKSTDPVASKLNEALSPIVKTVEATNKPEQVPWRQTEPEPKKSLADFYKI